MLMLLNLLLIQVHIFVPHHHHTDSRHRHDHHRDNLDSSQHQEAGIAEPHADLATHDELQSLRATRSNTSLLGLVLALSPVQSLSIAYAGEFSWTPHVYFDNTPATGPPSVLASRGPPRFIAI